MIIAVVFVPIIVLCISAMSLAVSPTKRSKYDSSQEDDPPLSFLGYKSTNLFLACPATGHVSWDALVGNFV